MATLGSKAVGSIVKLKENGTLQEFYVAQHGYPTSGNGRTLMVRRYIYGDQYWNSRNTNTYASSAIDSWFNNTYYNLLDTGTKAQITAVAIPYTPGNGTDTVTTLFRKIFALSATELGVSLSIYNVEGVALPIYNTLDRAYDNDGIGATQWTRSPHLDSTSYVCFLGTGAERYYTYCIRENGVRPAFTLPSTLEVASDNSVITNTPPTTPSSITVPTTVIGGIGLAVSWGSSIDPDGNLSGYILERKVDSGTWTQVYKGSSRSATVSITYGWNNVQFRVKAYDSAGAESSYTTSAIRTVINNRTPVISGSNSNLGSFSEAAPSYAYTVTDADGDTVTVVETLDGAIQRSYTVTLGAENTFTLSSEAWQKVLNGSHTLEIKATDSNGASATRTLTFTKAVTSISFEQTVAMPADDMPMKALLNIQGSFPVGSILKVEICNNGNDEEPTWEDVTTRVLNGQKCYFSNTEKTAESWGVKIRVNLSRGTATEPCYIQTLGGNFG